MEKEMILEILLIGIVSIFGCGCIDTTEVSDVEQIDISEPAVVPTVPIEQSIVTSAPTLPAPKYAIGNVVGDEADAIAGCVIGSFNELGDRYSIQIVGNKEGTWMFYLNDKKHSVKRAELEERYPVLLAQGIRISDIPTLKQKDAKILSESTNRDVFEWVHIVGEVKNTGIETLKFVKVVATIYDKDGTAIAVESTYTQPHTLKRGQVAPFEIVCMNKVPIGAKYKLTVDWN
jgi:hypothetical protein